MGLKLTLKNSAASLIPLVKSPHSSGLVDDFNPPFSPRFLTSTLPSIVGPPQFFNDRSSL